MTQSPGTAPQWPVALGTCCAVKPATAVRPATQVYHMQGVDGGQPKHSGGLGQRKVPAQFQGRAHDPNCGTAAVFRLPVSSIVLR